MEEVSFTIPGEPTGKGRPRFVASYNPVTGKAFGKAHTPDKTLLYENQVRMEYHLQTNDFRFDDGDELDIKIEAYYGIPKSKSKKVKLAMEIGEIRPTKKPDIDNVIKVIADSLNNIAYKDDTQIVNCTCSKWFSYEPRVEVTIKKV
jgi:Holliday junction resolvase RusA-like endonuclease